MLQVNPNINGSIWKERKKIKKKIKTLILKRERKKKRILKCKISKMNLISSAITRE